MRLSGGHEVFSPPTLQLQIPVGNTMGKPIKVARLAQAFFRNKPYTAVCIFLPWIRGNVGPQLAFRVVPFPRRQLLLHQGFRRSKQYQPRHSNIIIFSWNCQQHYSIDMHSSKPCKTNVSA